tara:strand:- start:227 stop:979 length:753 start_codon:yes stop_codon:yes gene_type:complete
MSNISLVINTVSKNKDIWPMFFDQLEKHIPASFFNEKHIFVNHCKEDFPPGFEVSYFDSDKVYREQFVSCIGNVSDKYCIYISEDYVLYDDIRSDLISQFVDVLDNNESLSFVRFMRGGVVDLMHQYKSYQNLYKLYNSLPYFYTNQAALWKTKDLQKIHVCGPNLHIANKDAENSFEFQASKTCEKLGINGVFYQNGEPKRGMYHYDTEIFPHVSTALVKGKWNISEYPKELSPLLEKYGINVDIRGSV